MKFVATKNRGAMDLQALHRVRRAAGVATHRHITRFAPFMLETWDRVRQGNGFLRTELPTSLRHAPMPCRHACCVSSRSWQATGAGWISASMAYPARSKHWPVKIRHVRA